MLQEEQHTYKHENNIIVTNTEHDILIDNNTKLERECCQQNVDRHGLRP